MPNTHEIGDRAQIWYQTVSETDNTSLLWKDKRVDFQTVSGKRGYGLNTIASNDRIQRFLFFFKLGRLLTAPAVQLYKISVVIRQFYSRVCSKLFLGNKYAAELFQLSKFDNPAYPGTVVGSFSNEMNPAGIYFSHNSLKLFSYLGEFWPHLENSEYFSKRTRFLEIGAGLFNFGHMLSLRKEHFEYVVVDLPEMIVAAISEISRFYNPSYELFLPTEIADFHLSTSPRKVLFITPEQLEGLNYQCHVFINHESFGEMGIDTVNSYLAQVRKLLVKNGLIFLVNRHSRVQAQKHHELVYLESENDITAFSDYELDFIEPIVRKVDPFRQRLAKQNTRPNVLLIGTVSN